MTRVWQHSVNPFSCRCGEPLTQFSKKGACRDLDFQGGREEGGAGKEGGDMFFSVITKNLN